MGNGDRLSLDSIQDSSLDNIDLVVLSACETGVGLTGKDEDGVEVLGIGYQFQRGGAKAAISSLWSINDGSTQTLMNIFYGLLQQGVPKAEALQQAQIALINGDFTAGGKLRSNFIIETAPGQTTIPTNLKHPFYWAPFILIGNGL
jgi:CHAT domain-containing protein